MLKSRLFVRLIRKNDMPTTVPMLPVRTGVRAGIGKDELAFDKSSLKRTETIEKHFLPSSEFYK